MSSSITTAGKLAMLDGIAGHKWRAALFTSGASIDHMTNLYDPLNEVPEGSGYQTGGVAISATTGIDKLSNVAWLDFSNATWKNASFTARYMLVYDATDSNRAYVVIDFGKDKTGQGGEFTFKFPVPDAESALIRL